MAWEPARGEPLLRGVVPHAPGHRGRRAVVVRRYAWAELLRRVQPLKARSLNQAQRRPLRSTERRNGPLPQPGQRRTEEPLQCPWQKRFRILKKR